MSSGDSEMSGSYVETSAEDEQERLETLLSGTHSVMFREAAEHVARVIRVLSRTSSHMLLLGQGTNGCSDISSAEGVLSSRAIG
jgi:NAD(P)H-hydrate repair Nnr-like enzyme with NAD(P)H-hydrate epimerase domain